MQADCTLPNVELSSGSQQLDTIHKKTGSLGSLGSLGCGGAGAENQLFRVFSVQSVCAMFSNT